ncbi:MAG: anaerobic sulfatase maturase [Deltaproteobacteria bacterium]|nr:anaerobic sulfatase maturase [Deltaproteobacteria bacterium]
MTEVPSDHTLPPRAFHLLAKPTGAICNLDCDYCFFLSKESLYPGSRFRMADELLDSYIRQLIGAQQCQEVSVAWQGGEPMLMGLDFFRRSIQYQNKYRRPGMTISNTIQTNGTLIDDEWAAFFAENDFLVGISIDGPRGMHDAYRRDKAGEPTFDRVVRGLDLLRDHGVEFNALVTLHRANADHPLEVYRFLRDDLGIRHIQLIPIVERVAESETGEAAAGEHGERGADTYGSDRPPRTQRGDAVTERSITAEQYGRFLIAIFEEWVRRDVAEVYVDLFDVALANWMGEPSGSCVFSPTCGLALAMEHNGDVYSCDHFVEPEYLLGNIADTPMSELVASTRQRRFGHDKLDTLPDYCRRCSVRFACHGGCPKDRFVLTPDGEPGLNYLCAGYMAFFEHVDRPMRIMTELARRRRAPAEIMQLYAAEDAERDAARIAPSTRC